jgi:replicative DNA helicase
MTTWQDASEVVAGLILENRLSINSVRPELFFGEYKNLVQHIKNGTTEPEDLILKSGLLPFNTALDAAKSLNGAGEMADWVALLEQSAVGYNVGRKLEKLGRNFQNGSDVDWGQVKELLAKSQNGISTDFVPLSEVTSGEVKFIPTGWLPFDTHIGGFPEAGLIVVGGNPGVGKTSTMVKFASKFVKEHKDKTVVIFSIEMLLKEIAGRFREITDLTKDMESRIMLDDVPVTPEQAINKASTIDNLGLIEIDFADLMIRGETNESSMAHIYRTLMIGAKQLHVPIALYSQLSYAYEGGIPRPRHIRYTSMAQALAWMLLMLYNPSNDFYAEREGVEKDLPIKEDRAYTIAWKIRGGFRKHRDASPGAIQIPFRGDKGWSDKAGRWYSLRKYS